MSVIQSSLRGNNMRLYGKNPVIERLRSNPTTIKKIFIEDNFSEASYIHQKAKKWGISVFIITRARMIKIARNINTQGILVEVDDFVYTPYDELLEDARDKHKCILFLDELNDPQNLGGIIRSVACLGKFSIVLPTHDSVSVTDAVLRVASGGDNYVKIARVSNLTNAIKSAKDSDFEIAGAVVEGGESLIDVTFPYPLGLVVGSEQKGIREVIRKHLDLQVTIPMAAASGLSYNVTHATTMFCYEITRQKKLREKK